MSDYRCDYCESPIDSYTPVGPAICNRDKCRLEYEAGRQNGTKPENRAKLAESG